MAFGPGFERAGGVELLRAGLDVAVAAIDWRQFGPQAEDRDVDRLASLAAEVVFGRLA